MKEISEKDYWEEANLDDKNKDSPKNHAFWSALNNNCEKKYYQYQLTYDQFLELLWCPKGKEERDAIDKITNDTRKIKDMVEHFQKNNENENKFSEDEKKYVNEFFKKSEIQAGKNRIFLLKKGQSTYILDGLHRAGSLVKSLSLAEEFPVFYCFLCQLLNKI